MHVYLKCKQFIGDAKLFKDLRLSSTRILRFYVNNFNKNSFFLETKYKIIYGFLMNYFVKYLSTANRKIKKTSR